MGQLLGQVLRLPVHDPDEPGFSPVGAGQACIHRMQPRRGESGLAVFEVFHAISRIFAIAEGRARTGLGGGGVPPVSVFQQRRGAIRSTIFPIPAQLKRRRSEGAAESAQENFERIW